MYRFLQLPGALMLLSLFTTAQGFNWQNNVNFSACYQNFVLKIPQNCSDERQVCVNNTFGDLTHPGLVYLTYDTCLAECGDGFGFWDIKDILLRISLWVTPAIVLIAHYHFPPLGSWNKICVIAHILADPIDTLWCLLTRITIRQKLLNKATRWQLSSAGAIATIWATYDEFGFQDPSADFKAALDALRTMHGYAVDFLGVKEGRRPDRILTQKLKGRFSSSQPPDQLFLEQAQRAIQSLDVDERLVLYHIELTAQRLVFNREESLLTTWISIFGLMSALLGAFVRTWIERLNNQTAHTIATVTLLLVIVPIVKLSGNLGAFTSSTAPIDIINTLRRDLENEFGPQVAALFPPLKNIPSPEQPESLIRYAPIPSQEEDIPLTSRNSNRASAGQAQSLPSTRALLLLSWPPRAPYTGLNNSYRPSKALPSNASDFSPPSWYYSLFLPNFLIFRLEAAYRHRHAILLLFVSATWILIFCYIPALLISFLAPLRGFACRSLAWTAIAIAWIASLTGSLLLSFLQSSHFATCLRRGGGYTTSPLSAKRAWDMTCVKDVLITLFIALVVVAQQTGLYNSCYCRSGELSGVRPSYVNLNPLTEEQVIEGWKMWVPTPGTAFLLSLAGILVIERWLFVESGSLFVKGREGRERMLVWVGCLEVPEAERKARRAQRDTKNIGESDQGTNAVGSNT